MKKSVLALSLLSAFNVVASDQVIVDPSFPNAPECDFTGVECHVKTDPSNGNTDFIIKDGNSGLIIDDAHQTGDDLYADKALAYRTNEDGIIEVAYIQDTTNSDDTWGMAATVAIDEDTGLKTINAVGQDGKTAEIVVGDKGTTIDAQVMIDDELVNVSSIKGVDGEFAVQVTKEGKSINLTNEDAKAALFNKTMEQLGGSAQIVKKEDGKFYLQHSTDDVVRDIELTKTNILKIKQKVDEHKVIVKPIDELIPTPVPNPADRAANEQRIVDALVEKVNLTKQTMTGSDKEQLLANRAQKAGYNVEETTKTVDGEEVRAVKFTAIDAETGETKEFTLTTEELQSGFDKKSEELAEKKARRDAERKEAMDPTMPEPKLPGNGMTEARDKVAGAIEGLAQSGQSGATTMAELYATTEDNTLKINDLYNQIDRLDEKMDGVMASTQAVTAARPYLYNGQTSAIGVGIGAAGSEQAIAVGYAHRINDNWSANANVSATSGNDTEVSAGAGVSFAW